MGGVQVVEEVEDFKALVVKTIGRLIKLILTGQISNENKIQGTKIMAANKMGNNTVQQKDISLSKRILGKANLII